MAQSTDGHRAPRLRQGALITAGSAVVLVVVMFAMKWYGVDELPGNVSADEPLTYSENAWHGLTILRWVMLVTIFVALGSVLLHGSQHGHGAKTNTGALVAILGAVTAVLLIYRVLIDLPSPHAVVDQKLGAYIGVLATLGIALGGYESMLEERARGRRLAAASRAPRRVAPERAER